MKIASVDNDGDAFVVDREFLEAAQGALDYAMTTRHQQDWSKAAQSAVEALRVYEPLGAAEQLIVDRITEAVNSYGTPVGPAEQSKVSAYLDALLIMRGEIDARSGHGDRAEALDELRTELAHRGVKLR